MMKKLFLSILLALGTVLITVPVAAGAVPEGLDHTTQEEWDVLRYTNIERAKAGLPLLVTFDRMQKMAGVRCNELPKKFSHTRPNGTGPETVFAENNFTAGTVAENIAMGQTSAKEVVQGWMNSSGHRENILREVLRYMGTGYTKDGKTYWVQLFAGSNVAECKELTFYEDEGYFKLKLKSGIIAYAPYDPISSPEVNGKVTFNYPGVDSDQSTTPVPDILEYPTKKTYTIGEGFDITGLNAVIISDGKETKVNDKITFFTSKTVELTQGRPLTTTGTKVVEIRYNGKKTDEYTIHVVTESVETKQPIAAQPINSTIYVNGKAVAFDAYNINDNNYFKLRDIAYILNGTQKQFDIGWDGAANSIALTSGNAYTAVGGEMSSQGGSPKIAIPTDSKVTLNGTEVKITAYNIDNNNYFKLRDIGEAFNFGVDWDASNNAIVISTNKGYGNQGA